MKEYELQLGLIRKLDQYEQNRQTGSSNQRFNQNVGGVSGGEGQSGLGSIILDRHNTGFILDREGMLELPDLGYLNFNNLTLVEAERMLKDRLQEGKLFETPIVHVECKWCSSFDCRNIGSTNLQRNGLVAFNL